MKLVSVALAAEAVVILAVILTMPYTEIDWKAYMEGVEGFLAGDVDYRSLKSGTGPLDYPGGFVWVYSVLYYLTKKGEAMELAQWLHAGVYLVTLTMVLRLYTRSGLTWKTIIPLFVSKRIRSLYVLQLSSDCWAMLFLFAAVSLIAGRPSRAVTRSRQWFIGCLCYSFAVSIKMDILLFAPGMLYVMLRTLPFWRVVWYLFVCAALQVAVGLPFLVYDYRAYLAKSVKLDYGLIEQWPVNYRFLDTDLVRRPEFGQALFAMTVATWILLWRTRWAARTYLTDSEAQVLHPAIEETRRQSTLSRGRAHGDEAVDEAQEQAVYASTLLTFFEANLVGVIFARSIHYQFYTRFFYTVPLVLAYTKFPRVLRLMSFALIRQGFESFPPTPNTSIMLQGGFALALFALLFLGRDTPEAAKREAKDTARDNAPNLPHAKVTGNAAGKKKIQ